MNAGIGDAAKKGSQTTFSSRRIGPLLLWLLALAAIAFMLSGCAMVGPDLEKPEPQVMDDWMAVQSPELNAGETDYSEWWRVFDDPVLQQLIESAYRQNPSLQIAGIRIYEARAQLGIAVGRLYPQQQFAFGDLTTNKLSTLNETTLIDSNFNSLSLGFDAAWELDIWGRFRRSVQSGVANLAASVASTRVSDGRCRSHLYRYVHVGKTSGDRRRKRASANQFIVHCRSPICRRRGFGTGCHPGAVIAEGYPGSDSPVGIGPAPGPERAGDLTGGAAWYLDWRVGWPE